MLRRQQKTVDYGSRLQRIIADSFRQSWIVLQYQQIAADCGHVTQRLYKILSGAALLLLSFLQLWILVYRQSNCTGLRDPLAVLVPRLTELLTITLVTIPCYIALLVPSQCYRRFKYDVTTTWGRVVGSQLVNIGTVQDRSGGTM